MSRLTEVKLPLFPRGEMFIKPENGPMYMATEWHKWLSILIDSVPKVTPFSFTLDPGNIAANSTNNQSVTVQGLTTQDVVVVNKPAYLAGVVLDYRVSAANTLSITFANVTTGAINPGSETYTGYGFRR